MDNKTSTKKKLFDRHDGVPESFIKALQTDDAFARLNPDQQCAMAYCILEAGTGRRKHNIYRGSTFSSKELIELFGQKVFIKINNGRNPIYDGLEENLDLYLSPSPGWSYAGNIKCTKGYSVTWNYQCIVDKYLDSAPTMSDFITLDNKIRRKLPQAIEAKDSNGNTAKWRSDGVLNKIPVNIEKLQELKSIMGAELTALNGGNDKDKEKLKNQIRIIGRLIRLAHTNDAGYGFVGISYRECKTGRIFSGSELSMQSIPKRIRAAALQGKWDIDIENCHFAIFMQLAKPHYFKAIQHYLDNKKEIRASIAKDVGTTNSQVKDCLLSMVYGARLSESEKEAISGNLDHDLVKVKAFNSHPIVLALHDEIKVGGKIILANHPTSQRGISNAIGKTRPLKDDEGKNTPDNKKLSHIIQGIEAKALMEVVKLHPNKLVLLVHDGFVSPVKLSDLEINTIKEAIQKATGIELNFDQKEFIS